MDKLILLFKALSDRNRVRALAALTAYEELCACQITELLQVTGATASRHMGILIQAGIVTSRKDGRWVYYRLNRKHAKHRPILNWLKRELADDPEIEVDLKRLRRIVASDPVELCRRQRGEACCPESYSRS